MPNSQLKHIYLENNDNRSVTYSRDTQEVPYNQGVQVLRIIHSYKHETSIFDDFQHYDNLQKLEGNKKVVNQFPSYSHSTIKKYSQNQPAKFLNDNRQNSSYYYKVSLFCFSIRYIYAWPFTFCRTGKINKKKYKLKIEKMFVIPKSLKTSVIAIDQKLKIIKDAMKIIVKKITFKIEIIAVFKIKSVMINIVIGMTIIEVAIIIIECAEVGEGPRLG